ncbi:MAG: hypothetical protein R2865_13500 [Deinococcales bacterium]
MFGSKTPVILIPVIFTTANLWVSDADLTKADIETGNLDFSKYQHSFERVDWVYYQYQLSPGIKHTVSSSNTKVNSLDEILIQDYLRTVVIVGPGGIDKFLEIASTWRFT